MRICEDRAADANENVNPSAREPTTFEALTGTEEVIALAELTGKHNAWTRRLNEMGDAAFEGGHRDGDLRHKARHLTGADCRHL